MPAENSDLRQRLESLLATQQDRGALLRELSELATDKGFSDLVEVWAPPLVEREPVFFETFLLRHLSGFQHSLLIEKLLPTIEAGGNDALFNGLYRKLAREDLWDKDIRALVSRIQDVDELQRAVRRREIGSEWFGLSEDTALALYQRSPQHFGEFVAGNVRRGWTLRRTQFTKLRDVYRRGGDEELFWKVFRRTASTSEWKEELQKLLKREVAPDDLSRELQVRHPEGLWDLHQGADVVVAILEKHGRAALPYIEKNLDWINRGASARLMQAVEKAGDDETSRRILFLSGDVQRWNRSLRDLLNKQLSAEELLAALERRSPPDNRWNKWTIEKDVAVGLYERDRMLFRPFLERHLGRGALSEDDLELFHLALRHYDHDFLDFLTFHVICQLGTLVPRAHPTESAIRAGVKPDEKARKKLNEVSQVLNQRLEDLLFTDAAGEFFVRHAANVLDYFRESDAWVLRHRAELPTIEYLATQHNIHWHQFPQVMRELLESTNVLVQQIALEKLSAGYYDPPHPVVENLDILRAILLGKTRINMKKKALQCLEAAASAAPHNADRILPLLEEAMAYQGRHTLDERIIVSFVRIRHARNMQTAA